MSSSASSIINPFTTKFNKLIKNRYRDAEVQRTQTIYTIKSLISNIKNLYKSYHNTPLKYYVTPNKLNIGSYVIDVDKLHMQHIFWDLRPYIYEIVINSIPDAEIPPCLTKFNPYNLECNIELIELLIKYNLYDLLIWWLYIPAVNSTSSTTAEMQQESYYKMGEYLSMYDKLLEYLLTRTNNFVITEKMLLFVSDNTYMLSKLPGYTYIYNNSVASFSSISSVSSSNEIITSIMRKYSSLSVKWCPWLIYYSGNIAKKNYSQNNNHIGSQIGKKRICFISDGFNKVGNTFKTFASIIGKLATLSAYLDVYIGIWVGCTAPNTTPSKICDTFISKFRKQNKLLELDVNSIEKSRQLLEQQEIDIIYYCELFNSIHQNNLSHSRIAPIQIANIPSPLANSVSLSPQFSPNIDNYICSKWFCQANQANPSITFTPHLGMFYIEPCLLNGITLNTDKSAANKSTLLKQYGIPVETANIYGLFANPEYIGTDFFKCVIGKILTNDINAYILLSNKNNQYTQKYLIDIRTSINSSMNNDVLLNRIKWINTIDIADYMNILSCCKVYLEPANNNINTIMDALSLNIPVVGLNSIGTGNFSGIYSNSILNGLYKYIENESIAENGEIGRINLYGDCCVNSMNEYVNKCIEIANNEYYKNKISRKIQYAAKYIFRNQVEIAEYDKALMNYNNKK